LPTLLLQDGFKFFFYANEHLPKHIHVTKAENFCKINLEKMSVVENYFKKTDLQKVIAITKQNREYFLDKWDEYFKG